MVDVSCRHVVLDRDSLVRPGVRAGKYCNDPLTPSWCLYTMSLLIDRRKDMMVYDVSEVKVSRDLQACDHPSSWAAEALGWD